MSGQPEAAVPPGPSLVCPGCGSPDVDLRRGLLCGTCGPLVMPADEFAALKAAARTFGAVALKPCGCGPDDPCAVHADRSEVIDWQARAEAAEAKLARIRAEASEWATLAPADEWAESLVDTFKADVGRVLLAITGSEEEARHA